MSAQWEEVRRRIAGLVRLPEGDWMSDLMGRVQLDDRALSALGGDAEQQRLMRLIIAMARVYGLDPTWVLTGEYDPTTHRLALESNTDEIAVMTTQILKRARTTTDSRGTTPG